MFGVGKGQVRVVAVDAALTRGIRQGGLGKQGFAQVLFPFLEVVVTALAPTQSKVGAN
jgi:hypothetical protein